MGGGSRCGGFWTSHDTYGKASDGPGYNAHQSQQQSAFHQSLFPTLEHKSPKVQIIPILTDSARSAA
jgi:hypothetical protein